MNWSRWANCWLLSALLSSSAACTRAEVEVTGETVKRVSGASAEPRSAVFDGKRLRLRGARGETLGVQVRFSNPEQAEVSLTLPQQAASIQGYRVGYVTVQEPSTRLYGSSTGRGSYPDPLLPMAQPRFRADRHAFFDVHIQAGAAPGDYAGELRIGERRFAAELRVEPVTIDLRRDPLVWVFYLPKEIAHLHHLRDEDNEALLRVERVYHELFREHGTYLAANMRPDRFPARREFVRDVKFWPVSVDTTSEASITADVRRWLELFEGSEVTPFAIPIDEPRTLAQKQRAKWIAEVMGRAGGKAPRLLRGVTDAASAVYAGSMDLYIAPDNIPGARARSDAGQRFWTYNGRPPQAGSMIIDTDGTALRTWGWIAQRYGIELWYAWEGLYYEDRYNRGGPTDVWKDPITFDERSKGGEDFGNGDGLLAYPGPVPSLRLKALRRGLQDRLLLRKLSDCAGRAQADAIAARVMPRALGEAGNTAAWPADEQAFERARSEVLDALSARCRDAA